MLLIIFLLMFCAPSFADNYKKVDDGNVTKEITTNIDVKNLIHHRDLLQVRVDEITKQLDDIQEVIDVKKIEDEIKKEKEKENPVVVNTEVTPADIQPAEDKSVS